MRILIAGASGFIGKQLVMALGANNHLTLLGRSTQKLEKTFKRENYKNLDVISWDELNNLNAQNFDALINLAGHNISDGRWSDKVKKLIINSRVETTQKLVNWVVASNAKNIHIINANAVGYYGLQKNSDLTELNENTIVDTQKPTDFLSEVAIKWQEPLNNLMDNGFNVTIARFGVVLKRGEGMLKKLGPVFYLGAGSVIGDGRQYISWVHIDDVINAFRFFLARPQLKGVFNVTSLYPVSQKEFAKTLAKVLKRPLFFKMPPFMVSLIFGEMGETLLLRGQKVVPSRLLDSGFEFKYPKISDALNAEFK